ncbi:MAG: Fe-only nitrogenase accessory AnfO family protein [Eubacteriales bacterium]
MPVNVAVCVDETGETASLYDDDCKIVVYRRKQGEWAAIREGKFVLKELGMKDLRNKLAEVAQFMQSCRVFVCLSIAGVPYFELEKANFSIWEFAGKPGEFLDYVLEEEEKREQEAGKESNKVIPMPVETSGGRYRISLEEIQEKGTGVTSKQVLIPFLRKVKFYSLEVHCSHVPPWLEAELAAGNLAGDMESGGDGIKITITKRCCSQP